jgi:hypothetical protein
MRTTVEFEEDTAKAIEALRLDRGIGVSEAVNLLIRKGLLSQEPRRVFRQRTEPLGLLMDVSNVAEALDALDGPEAR